MRKNAEKIDVNFHRTGTLTASSFISYQTRQNLVAKYLRLLSFRKREKGTRKRDRIGRNFEPWAEVVQVTEMLQDQVIQAPRDEGDSGEWMQDGKSLDGQAFDPVQIPDLEQVEKVPEVGVQCR